MSELKKRRYTLMLFEKFSKNLLYTSLFYWLANTLPLHPTKAAEPKHFLQFKLAGHREGETF